MFAVLTYLLDLLPEDIELEYYVPNVWAETKVVGKTDCGDCTLTHQPQNQCGRNHF